MQNEGRPLKVFDRVLFFICRGLCPLKPPAWALVVGVGLFFTCAEGLKGVLVAPSGVEVGSGEEEGEGALPPLPPICVEGLKGALVAPSVNDLRGGGLRGALVAPSPPRE